MKTEKIFEGNRIEAGSILSMLQKNKIDAEIYTPPEDSTGKAIGYVSNEGHTHIRVNVASKATAIKLTDEYLQSLK